MATMRRRDLRTGIIALKRIVMPLCLVLLKLGKTDGSSSLQLDLPP
jgi:hypothetical protein